MQKIQRKRELDKLSVLKDRNLIKVITGVRRCGKSTLLLQFQDLLKVENPSVSVVSINMDLPEFRFLAEKNWKEIYDYIQDRLQKNTMNYVFIDEIQNIPEFEKLLEGLFVNPDRAFAGFVHIGGFPEAIGLAQESENFAYKYLNTVFQNIYENDIQKRHTIYYETSYREVVHFLTDSVGSSVSAGNIAKVLTANGKKIDNKTVAKYIDTLVESYLFYKVSRYDIKGKQHLATQEKYYPVDLGLRYALPGKEFSADTGHLLENVIFLELQRRNEQVWIGKADNLEVDFVARGKDGYTKYIQVALTVKEQKTRDRELAPFAKIPDYNERLLLTTDYEEGSHNGIKQMNAIDWLLND
jgi:predicted AAA+ superfamily ATPase